MKSIMCKGRRGVFMFDDESAQVKQELLARGTKSALRLASEIAIPSDGYEYDETRTMTRYEECYIYPSLSEREVAK